MMRDLVIYWCTVYIAVACDLSEVKVMGRVQSLDRAWQPEWRKDYHVLYAATNVILHADECMDVIFLQWF